MKFCSQPLLATETEGDADKKRVAADTCASCSPSPLCIPRDLNRQETLQFEHLISGKRRIARHASLYRKHDSLGMLYVVRFGQFKLIGGDRISDQRVAGFRMAGDLVGLEAIATGQHNFRLVALENSEVCEIPFAALRNTMSVEPAIQRQFLQSMSEALNNEFDRGFLLAETSLDERFASFLLKLGERYARLGYSDKSFRLATSRSDICSYLGTTIESVSRLIARFNLEGAVSINGRMVELRDRPYLEALTCGDKQTVKRAELRHAEGVSAFCASH